MKLILNMILFILIIFLNSCKVKEDYFNSDLLKSEDKKTSLIFCKLEGEIKKQKQIILSYNFLNGCFIDKEKLFEGNSSEYLYNSTNPKIYNNRYIINLLGGMFDINKKEILLKGAGELISINLNRAIFNFNSNMQYYKYNFRNLKLKKYNNSNYFFNIKSFNNLEYSLDGNYGVTWQYRRKNKRYDLLLYKSKNKYKVIDNSIVDAPLITLNHNSFGEMHIPIIWLSKNTFIYAKYHWNLSKDEKKEIYINPSKLENKISAKIDIIAYSIDENKSETVAVLKDIRPGSYFHYPSFFKYQNNIVFTAGGKIDYIIDVDNKEIKEFNPEFYDLGFDFKIEYNADKNTNERMFKYQSENIGNIKDILVNKEEVTDGYIIVECFDIPNQKHTYQMWNKYTKEWTIINAKGELIGWYIHEE